MRSRLWGIGLLVCGLAGAQSLRIPLPSPRPMGYRDADGTPRGFAVDSLAEAARRAGLSIQWAQPGNPESNNEALRRGDLDIVAGVPSADRRREFSVTSPWWSSELVLLALAASPIRDESQLAGKRLALPTGAGQEVQQHYFGSVAVPVSSAVAAANAVCDGSADAAVIAAMYLRELLFAAPAPCRGLSLRTVDSKFVVDYVLIARPAMANEARALKRGLDQITADGMLAAIAARYPPVSTPHATRLAELLRLSYDRRLMALGAAAAALLIALAAVFVVKQAGSRRRLRAANEQLRNDLEARARAEAALRESEERFRTLFEAAPIAVLAFDRSGAIVFANPESSRMFGRDSLVGAPIESLAPESARAPLAKARENAGEFSVLTGLRADGTEFPIELRLGRVQSPGGLTLAFIADTSERAALQQQLLQSQKLESVGQLAGGVAHDFNNLLTVITGYAHIGLEDFPDGDPRRDAFLEIADAATRAAALTGQLLAFSRRQRAMPRVFSLNELLGNVEKMLGRLIGEDIRLQLLQGEIGPVCADPGQIEQVVMNLAVNARDAMTNGGLLTISTAPAPGGQVAMRVADTGSGMSPEVRARIFEPFFTTKEQGKGTGLGLSTVYGIVTQAGGEVQVESAVGAGTTFTILLPVASESVGESAVPPAAIQTGGSETILVAEDEHAVRRFVCSVLKSHGYLVLEASNGRDALDVANGFDGPIDLLLSDVVMPEMGGIDLAERLGELRPATAILHMCGYSDRLLEESGHALLRKPFSPEALLARVRQALDGA